MSRKFRNKYRIESARLQHWDYGSNAMYFVTICTHNREHYFGKIADGKMELSEIGKMVEYEWLKTFELRPDMNLYMGEFVVMPNHFHAVIGIGGNQYNTQRGGARCTGAMHCAATAAAITAAASTTAATDTQNRFGPQSKNLASIIRGFKSAVTKFARINHINFEWQSRFWDHIIRNDGSFQRISDYIMNNPMKWSNDKFFQ